MKQKLHGSTNPGANWPRTTKGGGSCGSGGSMLISTQYYSECLFPIPENATAAPIETHSTFRIKTWPLQQWKPFQIPRLNPFQYQKPKRYLVSTIRLRIPFPNPIVHSHTRPRVNVSPYLHYQYISSLSMLMLHKSKWSYRVVASTYRNSSLKRTLVCSVRGCYHDAPLINHLVSFQMYPTRLSCINITYIVY